MSEQGIHSDLKRTPLFEHHRALGAKMVPFAGWEMPVQYEGVIPEHHAVRSGVGLFDVSHMGEIWIVGPEAEAAVQFLTCNDVRLLKDGKGQYSALINQNGGVVDDIIVYRFSAERFFLCVNASNTQKDFDWLTQNNRFNAKIENASAAYGQIAVQGPRAVAVVEKLAGRELASAVPYFRFLETTMLGSKVIVARTGYTGEDGFEVFVPWEQTGNFWNELLSADSTAKPAGLGARDTLRLEACYPLHGHELGDDISAWESGLGWIIKLGKGDFLGRAALEVQAQTAPARTLVAFTITSPGIARTGDRVQVGGLAAGVVSSGTKTPTVGKSIGLAFVATPHAAVGGPLEIIVRGNVLLAEIVKKPFYSRLKSIN